jgi:F-type H+-transporting ATPase subunit epsilon
MSMEVTVVDPESIAWKGEAKGLVLGISDGLYGILPGHADAVMLLSPSVLKINLTDEKNVNFFISGGCVKIEKGQVTVIADSTETKERIDIERARKAAERARARLNGTETDVDFLRARNALQRALTRLHFAGSSVDNL